MIPKLRFPQFTDEWQVRSFDQLFIFSSGKNIKQDEASPWFETPCVRYGELYHLYSEVINNVVNYTNIPRDDLVFSKGDEILLPSAGEDPMDIGSASALTIENVAIGRTINVLRPKHVRVYDQIFVAYYINSVLKKRISRLAKGNSISNVYNSDLKRLTMNLPDYSEQEKIAEFLTAVDERIMLMEKKLELLKKYKKGVMQKIFTRQIRFKDENGNDYPEWEEKKVIDVYHFRATNSLSRDCLSDTGKFKNIHYGDIHKKYGTHLDTLAADIPKIYKAPRVLIEKFIPESTLQAKDVIMADASEDYNDIGKSLEIINTEDMTVAGLHTIVMRPNNPDDLALRFSAYMFNSYGVRKQIMKLATGVSVLGISLSNLMSVKLYLPTYGEQEKIADFLSSLDEKIELEAKRLDQAKQFKKFLLQRMFV